MTKTLKWRPGGHDLSGYTLGSGSAGPSSLPLTCGRLSGRRSHCKDGNVRAARQGIVDARGVGPSGGYRSRYVVESLSNPHVHPPLGSHGWQTRKAVHCARERVICSVRVTAAAAGTVAVSASSHQTAYEESSGVGRG